MLYIIGFSGIAPTRDCTHFLYILDSWSQGVGFIPKYNTQNIQLDNQRKICKKKVLSIQKVNSTPTIMSNV